MTIYDPFYTPKVRRQVALVKMGPRARNETPVRQQHIYVFEAVEEAIKHDASYHGRTDGFADIESVKDVLFKQALARKNLPDDLKLDDGCWMRDRLTKLEVEVTVNRFLFGRAGLYHWLMFYLKALDRLGYVERYQDNGARVPEIKKAKQKVPLSKVIKREIFGEENDKA